MENVKRIDCMKEMPVPPLLFRMAVPAVCANIVNALYNFGDRYFVGQYIGTNALAGIGLVFPLNNIVAAFTVMLGIGGSSIMSRALGASDRKRVDRTFTNMLFMAVIIGLTLSSLYFFFTESFVILCGGLPDSAVFPEAVSYLRVTSVGMFFMIINLATAAAIRSEGNTGYAMVVTATGALLNLLFDYVLIVRLGGGLKDAALATVFSQFISCGLGFLYFAGGRSIIRWAGFKAITPGTMFTIVSLGIAPAVFQGLSFINNILINHSLVEYGNRELGSGGGALAIAAVSIITSMESLAIMIIMGINSALSIIIGYNYGQRRYDRVLTASLTGQAIAGLTTLILWSIMMLYPRELFLFFNSGDTALANYGIRAVHRGKIFLWGLGFQTLASMFFSAIGKPGKALIISISRNGLFLIPSLLILPRIIGLDGVLYSSSISDFCSMILVSYLYIKGIKTIKGEASNG